MERLRILGVDQLSLRTVERGKRSDSMANREAIQKMRDFYAHKADAPMYMEEFGYFTRERWTREGHITTETKMADLFGFDRGGKMEIGELGWCEAEFSPAFTQEVLEDRGNYELVRDSAGRHVLYFKGRRNGFMPEFVDHPVKNQATWERDVKWRLDPDTASRHEGMDRRMQPFAQAGRAGAVICQGLIGGFMYLRSLIGPMELLYMVYDDPSLIHDCMQTWFALADRVIAEHQKCVTLDELFLAEDICYKGGSLISPAMMREFLFPYYQQLIENTKKRQAGRGRKLYLQIDTDGDCRPVIPVYGELGLDYMSPFEVASGCDVVALRKQYPGLLMRGGIDKRILARGKDAIDQELRRIIPFMRKQGGYIPVCDHGVPEEVAFEDYCHFRKRLYELGCV